MSDRAETQRLVRGSWSRAGHPWGLVSGDLSGCWAVSWLLRADMVCMAGGDVQGLGRSLAPTAASLPALPARPRGTAHTWPLCPASLPLTKTKESRLQGTGAWHPSAGNARPSPPWSLSARAPLLLGSREPVVGVELRPRLEGAGFSLGRVRQPEIEVGTLRPKPGQGLLSQLPILLVSSLRIPRA